MCGDIFFRNSIRPTAVVRVLDESRPPHIKNFFLASPPHIKKFFSLPKKKKKKKRREYWKMEEVMKGNEKKKKGGSTGKWKR